MPSAGKGGRALSAAERKERVSAHKLLRECAQILKDVKVSQNAIGRRANYTSGYMPQLLKEDAAVERLTRQSVTRLTTAIDLLSREAGQGLPEAQRVVLRRNLETLKAKYGTVRHEIVRPGQPLKRAAINYLHRNVDGLLTEDLAAHNSFMVDGVLGPPYCGKTWALEYLSFSAAETHDVFHVDLSTPEPKQDVEVRFINELRSHRSMLVTDDGSEPFTSTASVRFKDLAEEILSLREAARKAAGPDHDRQILVLVDGPDRAGDPYRLLNLLLELQRKVRYFPDLADVWLVVAFSEPGATEDRSTLLRPTWEVSYFEEQEVERLFELHQEAGSLRDRTWDGLRDEVRALGGHPALVAQFFDDCHRLGLSATAEGVLSPVGSGWGLLDEQSRRFAAAWRRTHPRSFEKGSQTIVDGTDIDIALSNLAKAEDSLRRLLYRFGFIKGEVELMPFVKTIGNGLRAALHAERTRGST